MSLERRVLVPLQIAPDAPALGARVHTLRGRSMGTTWCVTWSGPRVVDAPGLHVRIQQALDEVVAQMSPWEHGSDISRYNRAPADSWHALPEAFAQVLACALHVADVSEGAFDPSAGELVDLWGFGPPGPRSQVPDARSVQAALRCCGWRRLRVQDGRVYQPGGSRLDLSAIAKGHAVDRIARLLSQRGIENHLVEVGGELRGTGVRPDGQPWWVDLHVPPGAAGQVTETRVALHGLSVATSGDYLRRYTDADGAVRSHTIDPRIGWPVSHGLVSVSVLHADCMRADAWSTALTVLGVDEGLALARRHDIAALFVQRVGDRYIERSSPALEAMAL